MTESKDEIESLIKQLLHRREVYNKNTIDILVQFDNIIEAISLLVSCPIKDVSLRDINLMDDCVLFTGASLGKIGDIVTSQENEMVTITQENRNDYVFNILIEVPFELVFSNADKIYNYLMLLVQQKTNEDPSTTDFDHTKLDLHQQITYNSFMHDYAIKGVKH